MTRQSLDYWYDYQIARYLKQFIAIFAKFKYKTGKGGRDNTEIFVDVPCVIGDMSRQVGHILRQNTENKVWHVPLIACYIQSLQMAPERRQDPNFIGKLQVTEREFDEDKQVYTSDVGFKYSVERYMPVPYNMTMQADIWTSNWSTKLQLMEQILTIFNPALDLQTSRNPLDWTVLTYVELKEITWSSRSIPQGTDTQIDAASLMFEVPIWLNPPAKVMSQRIIEQIVIDILDADKEDPDDHSWETYEFFGRVIITPGNRRIRVNYIGNDIFELTLLSHAGIDTDEDQLPTVITSKEKDFTVTIGDEFSINGTTITITGTGATNVVDDIRAADINDINARVTRELKIQIINNNGTDITLANVTGTPLADIGFSAATYEGGKLAWWRLLDEYGGIRPFDEFSTSGSQLFLKKDEDIDDSAKDVYGWIEHHPTKQHILIWNVDVATLPTTTLTAINQIINPQLQAPGKVNPTAVGQLPVETTGDRYLLTDETGNSVEWQLVADVNDIIEWDGSAWSISFDASANANITAILIDNSTGKYLEWDGEGWSFHLDTDYFPGFWRLKV